MHGHRDSVDLYDWDSYKRLEGWKQLFEIFLHVFAVIGMAFGVLIVLSATEGAVTNGIIIFFTVLSTITAAVATAFLWATNHPNPWVGRAAFAILFLLPAILVIIENTP